MFSSFNTACSYHAHVFICHTDPSAVAHVLVLPHQADNPNPVASGLDDDSVIDRMTQELQAASKGMPAGFKLQPVQFEKVGGGRGSSICAAGRHAYWLGVIKACAAGSWGVGVSVVGSLGTVGPMTMVLMAVDPTVPNEPATETLSPGPRSQSHKT